MNGISLLLLLSSLGATTGVELDANNQPVYTVRIESLLINELRNGQTIPILVAAKDRRIRHFKIAMTPDGSSRNSGLSRAGDFNYARAGDLFDYEATQLDNGEIEYVVQISPERLESLAAGKAIEGDIASEIAEVDRYLIFMGVGQLPSQQRAAALAATGNASQLRSGGNNGLIPAGAEVRTAPPGLQSRNNAPPLARTPLQAATQPTPQRGFQTNEPLTQFNTRTNDPRTNYRNQPDQSTVSPPPSANWGQQGTSQQAASQNSTLPRSSSGLPTTADRNAQPAYNNPQYQQPTYPEPNAGYAQPNSAPYPQQGYGQNPPVGYPQPVPTLAARNEVPPAQQNTAPPTTPKIEAVPERPWTPLVLTTLALFASMGANAYLGWLSWSFFWRFRDAVTESARARANHSSSRQAA